MKDLHLSFITFNCPHLIDNILIENLHIYKVILMLILDLPSTLLYDGIIENQNDINVASK